MWLENCRIDYLNSAQGVSMHPLSESWTVFILSRDFLSSWWHCGAGNSITTLQLQGLGFNPELGLRSMCIFAYSSCFSVWIPLGCLVSIFLQNAGCRQVSFVKLYECVCIAVVWQPIYDVGCIFGIGFKSTVPLTRIKYVTKNRGIN